MTKHSTTTKKLTSQESHIIELLYRFRFLTRAQIQKFLHHKSNKTILLWLHRMKDLELISTVSADRLESQSGAYIYHLGKKGVNCLIDDQPIDRLTRLRLLRDHERSDSFIRHQLLLADLVLDLERHNTDDDWFEEVCLKPEFKGLDVEEALVEIQPDAYLIRHRGDRQNEYLLEILPDDNFAETLRSRIKKYLASYQNSTWEETSQIFPTIMLVCSNERTMYYLARYIRRLTKSQDIVDIRICLATTLEVRRFSIRGGIWQKINC